VRVLLGFGVLRDCSDVDTRGKTLTRYPHMLYATREAADEAAIRLGGATRVVEVFIEEEVLD
jgi:hypothetical protein